MSLTPAPSTSGPSPLNTPIHTDDGALSRLTAGVALASTSAFIVAASGAAALVATALSVVNLAATKFIIYRDIKTAITRRALPKHLGSGLMPTGLASLAALAAGPCLAVGVHEALTHGYTGLAFLQAGAGIFANALLTKRVHDDAQKLQDKKLKFESERIGLNYSNCFQSVGADVQLGILRAALNTPGHALWKAPLRSKLGSGHGILETVFGTPDQRHLNPFFTRDFKKLSLEDKADTLTALARLLKTAFSPFCLASRNEATHFISVLFEIYHTQIPANARHPKLNALNAECKAMLAAFESAENQVLHSRVLRWRLRLAQLPGAKDYLPITLEARKTFRYFGVGGYFRSEEFAQKSIVEKSLDFDYFLTHLVTNQEDVNCLRRLVDEYEFLCKSDEALKVYADRLGFLLENTFSRYFGVTCVSGKYHALNRTGRIWVAAFEDWQKRLKVLKD